MGTVSVWEGENVLEMDGGTAAPQCGRAEHRRTTHSVMRARCVRAVHFT